ncbi:hypothetical protein WA026_003414 [Henosepilachna vigintioctopunctata]|uniref:UDENN FNIP1/2-type domain-containing protein n=1 Tax=Henosepilachna vigintioctopunctata TaxID=420089 RepID=A0AAW1THG9_9CUCU
MALFNKLFTSRKSFSNSQEHVSEKNIGFAKDQVRVALFRECDFRGRKLLFDSSSVKKIQITPSMDNEISAYNKNQETFAEISDGYGYMYLKPRTDSSHLADMIFGLVAMSYRGSYFKIHDLENPPRVMFTQVFPSPKHMQKRKSSILNQRRGRTSSQSLEHSVRLDDSGTSISDHYSVHSTASDTLLVCRQSTPLDVPQKLTESNSSVICDSGVYGERSYSSCDGNKRLSSIQFWESLPSRGNSVSFSSSSLYKRWLRGSSLDQSGASSTGTMEETFCQPHQRSSKLGLAFILHLTPGQEEMQIQFLMEHIALLESMLWRARHATEIAYLRPNNFLSVLVKMVDVTSTWLTNLLSGPVLSLNFWTSLYSVKYHNENNSFNNNFVDCDNYNSIKISSANNQKEPSDILRSLYINSNNISESLSHNFVEKLSKPSSVLSGSESEKPEFSFSNITKIIKNEWDVFNAKLFGNSNKNNLAETFIQEFCELLDNIDIKDTNFFVSTLLTAVLTHHLGWVSTCVPSESDSQIFIDVNLPFNPLWGQLSDLYGAVGYPIKMAQTIILGNKKKDVVLKLINCLTYFIRCCDLERKYIIRSDIYEDNKTADYICHKNSCIPKENFKKYKDHLREMLNSNTLIDSREKKYDDFSNIAQCFPEKVEENTKKVLCRTKKSNFDLHKLEKKEISDKIALTKISSWSNLKELDGLYEKGNESFLENVESKEVIPFEKGDVVFVLGDDEKLVNIKKVQNSHNCKNRKDDIKKSDETPEKLYSDSARKISRPNFLDLVFKKYETFEEEFLKSNFRDKDFVKYETDGIIKPSTSWTSLQQAEEDEEHSLKANTKTKCENHAGCSLDKPFVRSQSVPPESKETVIKEEVKAKYRYSGVKFNLHQYPQVVTNYMRSKNLEMTNLSFSEITKRFDQISQTDKETYNDYSQYEYSDEMEALQTPSNASELEFTNDLTMDMPRQKHARESNEKKSYIKNSIPNNSMSSSLPETYSKQQDRLNEIQEETSNNISKMKMIYFPMPKSQVDDIKTEYIPYTVSLLRGLNDSYIPDLVLQGISAPKKDWESTLKNELCLTSQHSVLDQSLEESVAIIADTDTWEVHLVSSHTYVIDKSSSGVRVGMSQLIASMLDSLLKMWKLQVPAHLCLMHIEQRLQALCVRSKAVAEMLLATEFCSMEVLTSTLHLEVNDVPLLLAVASTFSPQVTQKYGISFQ